METVSLKTKNPVHRKVIKLRLLNYSYGAIAEIMGMSKNTVRSICQRNGVVPANETKQKSGEGVEIKCCKYCGEFFLNPWNRVGKQFCSDKCRTDWWNEHRRTSLKNEDEKENS